MSSKASSVFCGIVTLALLAVITKLAWVGSEKYLRPLFRKATDAVSKTIAPESHAALERAREDSAVTPVVRQLTPAQRELIQKLPKLNAPTPSPDGYQPPSQ